MMSRVRPAAPALRHVRYASAISVDASGTLRVPDSPIVPFIEGDGTGPGAWSGSHWADACSRRAAGGATRSRVLVYGHCTFARASGATRARRERRAPARRPRHARAR